MIVTFLKFNKRLDGKRSMFISRYMVYIDENGDAEGNYSVLALKRHPFNVTEHGLYPVAMFNRLIPNVRNLPVK